MCFEFEWLYWAQIAQEEERRRAQEQAARQQAAAARPEPQPERGPRQGEPVHA